MRGNIKLDEKQLNKKLAKTLNSTYCFTDKALKVGFNLTLDSNNNNHSNSKKKI